MASEMKPEYEPKTQQQKIGYLIEECGELLAAVGKTLRWGLESYNPELPPEERETNRQWVLRELDDVRRAVELAGPALEDSDEDRSRVHCLRAGLLYTRNATTLKEARRRAKEFLDADGFRDAEVTRD